MKAKILFSKKRDQAGSWSAEKTPVKNSRDEALQNFLTKIKVLPYKNI